MKKSNYNFFYKENFLENNLHQLMLDQKNWCLDYGCLVQEDGTYTIEQADSVIKNRYKDNTIVRSLLPEPAQNVVTNLENVLREHGVKDPVLFNFKVLTNITMDPIHLYGRWHKDFNLITHITDPLKLWFTMLCLTTNEVDSEFQVSPTSEWPNIWNIGVKKVLQSNQLFGHNMNLGHQYFQNPKNDLGILYVRWYDAG
jgi:hypothetical protein